MNALKVKKAVAMRERKERIRNELMKQAQKLSEQTKERRNEEEKYNALLHILHFFCILHTENGFGKVRLNRLLDAWQKYAPKLEQDLKDGVAWTKTLNQLEQLGVHLDYDRNYLERVHQRRYEEGVKHYGEDETDEKFIL